MFNVRIFTDIEMPLTGREKEFCLLEYARSQLNKTVQHAFVTEFSKQSPTVMQIWSRPKKILRGRLFVHEKRIWMTKNIRRDGRACLQKNLAKAKEIITKNKYALPIPANLEELKQRITIALQTATQDMLQRAWEELGYRIDVCSVSGGAHIEHV